MAFKWFSFDWLKSAERKELEQLRAEKAARENSYNTHIKPAIDQLKESLAKLDEIEEDVLPYINLIFTGDTITVIFGDGDIWSVKGDKDVYLKVKECKTKEEIEFVMYAKNDPSIINKRRDELSEVEEDEVKEILEEVKETFTLHPDFEEINGHLYLKGVNLPLPNHVKASFLELIEKKELNKMKGKLRTFEQEFEALKMFWCKLALNSVGDARENLLKYIRENKVQITSTGNFIGYRRIVSVSSSVDKSLIEFISSSYLKVKSWKKAPKNFCVWGEDDGTFRLIKATDIKSDGIGRNEGNLQTLYENLTNMEENKYTDNHSKKYDIRIGSVYRIKDSDIDLKGHYKSCGGALHISDGRNYDYTSFGDTPVVCIVNPMHVVKMDTGTRGKIGVREMFIAAKSDFKHGKFADIEDKTILTFDDEYNKKTLDELMKALKKSDLKVLEVEENVLPIKKKDVVDIAAILSKRTKKI